MEIDDVSGSGSSRYKFVVDGSAADDSGQRRWSRLADALPEAQGGLLPVADWAAIRAQWVTPLARGPVLQVGAARMQLAWPAVPSCIPQDTAGQQGTRRHVTRHLPSFYLPLFFHIHTHAPHHHHHTHTHTHTHHPKTIN